jgi:hypothetical protein
MWLAQVEMKVGWVMFLDHRPSFVSFKKGLYLTRLSICLRAAALGQSVPWESLLSLVAFLLAFSLGNVAVLRKLSV